MCFYLFDVKKKFFLRFCVYFALRIFLFYRFILKILLLIIIEKHASYCKAWVFRSFVAKYFLHKGEFCDEFLIVIDSVYSAAILKTTDDI